MRDGFGHVRVGPTSGRSPPSSPTGSASRSPDVRPRLFGRRIGKACFGRLAAERGDSWGAFDRLRGRAVRRSDLAGREPGDGVAARSAPLGELGWFHPMSCTEGAEAYESVLTGLGAIELLQLGLGPDGHTASLFPGSQGLSAPPGRLVVMNLDPSGRNPYPRLAHLRRDRPFPRLVVTVIGPDKADVLRRLAAGEDLPAAHVCGGRVVWLVDETAAARSPLGLPGDPDRDVITPGDDELCRTPVDELAALGGGAPTGTSASASRTRRRSSSRSPSCVGTAAATARSRSSRRASPRRSSASTRSSPSRRPDGTLAVTRRSSPSARPPRTATRSPGPGSRSTVTARRSSTSPRPRRPCTRSRGSSSTATPGRCPRRTSRHCDR